MRVLKIDISNNGLSKLRDELDTYKQGIIDRINQALLELADIGISVARTAADSSGTYGQYITFTRELKSDANKCEVIMIAKSTTQITEEWLIDNDGNTRTAEVDPLLMVEFGSGKHSLNPKGLPEVGQGTFPNQTHAFDPNGWYWRTTDGEWHHSTGYTPKQPMLRAYDEMVRDVNRVFKNAFKR